VVRFEIRGHARRFLLLTQTEASLCHENPGFPEPVCVRGSLAALVAWWRGDARFVAARRMGLTLDGPAAVVRAFPGWFDRYAFAHVEPARTRSGFRTTRRKVGRP
jgi:hypothetical protein